MTQTQEQKLSTYLMFRDSFTTKSLNEEIQPSLKSHFENFLYYLNLILKTKDMMDECSKNSENYSAVRNEIIQSTLSISRKVTAFALLEEMVDTQGTFCFIYNELVNESDSKLINQCKGLLHFISTYQTDLVDYGIDKDLILSYHSIVDRFQLLIENKAMENEIEQLHDSKFAELFNKTDEIFENKLGDISRFLVVRPS